MRAIKRLSNLLVLSKAGVEEAFIFRVGLLSMFAGNLIFIVIMYSLWKAIYLSVGNGTVNGMSFQDTIISICLITTLHTGMQVNLVEKLTVMIKTGEITVYLIKPVSFPIYMFFIALGDMVAQFLCVVLPSFILVSILTHGRIQIGIHILYFLISVLLGIIMNYCFNLCVSMLCIYTESGWGINVVKELIVSLFSGAVIPIVFFSKMMAKIVEIMPFQAMYNIPMRLLLYDKSESIISLIMEQLIWCIILILLSALLWKKSRKNIIVNGG